MYLSYLIGKNVESCMIYVSKTMKSTEKFIHKNINCDYGRVSPREDIDSDNDSQTDECIYLDYKEKYWIYKLDKNDSKRLYEKYIDENSVNFSAELFIFVFKSEQISTDTINIIKAIKSYKNCH